MVPRSQVFVVAPLTLQYERAREFAYDEGLAAGRARAGGLPFSVRPQYDCQSSSWARRRLGSAFWSGFEVGAGLA